MRTIYFYLPDTLADWEPGYVLAELRSGRYLKDPSAKYDVVLCGRTMDAVRTLGGLTLKPDVLITRIEPSEGDLLLLPGADTWLEPANEPVIVKIREVLDGKRAIVAAICGATLALAEAGLLDARPHTSNDVAALKMFCPHYQGEKYCVNEPAVTDDTLITASGLAPVEFAYHIFRRLGVMSPKTLEAWHGLFATRKPEFFYALLESLAPKQR